MKLSSLEALLEHRLSPTEFRDAITSDIAEYSENASTLGSVMPVRVTEDEDIVLSLENIRVLCDLFINKQLSSEELAFIADALQLSDRVDFDEGVPDLVDVMTDPEINGPFTVDHARVILGSV